MIVVFFCLLFLASSLTTAQWVQTNLASTSHIQEFAVRDSALFVATYGDGVFRTTNNGDSWTPLNTGLSSMNITTLALVDSQLFFCGAWPGGVYRSTNAGGNWTYRDVGLTTTNVQSIIAIHDTSADELTLLTGTYGGGVFRSTDQGQNWSPYNSGLTNHTVNAFLAIGQRIFAGTDSGAFVSMDTGKTWNAAGLSGMIVKTFSHSDTVVYTGIAGVTGGVYRSTDYGSAWTRIDTTFSSTNVWAVVVKDISILAGTIGGGVFRSNDDGEHWNDFSTGITSSNVQALLFDPKGEYVFAGTDHVGVWRRPISDILTVVTEPHRTTSVYHLSQNYPNPFNPTTTISFEVATAGKASVRVYDVLGREVTTLLDQRIEPGIHTLTWNTGTIPGGVYFYRIVSGHFSETRKMLLVK